MQTILLQPNSLDGINQQDPYWICVVLPYSIVDPLDRSKIFNGKTDGYQDVSEDGSKQSATKIDGIYVLDGDVTQWNTSSSKGAYIGGLNMTLRYGNNDWLQKLAPGDWCLFWAFEDVGTYQEVLGRLRKFYKPKIDSEYPEFEYQGNTQSLNNFECGLKFIGRLSSIRRHTGRVATGAYNVSYAVQARSFTEFNSVLYYNDLLAFSYKSVSQFFGDFGPGGKRFFEDLLIKGSKNGEQDGFVNNTKLIPNLANIVLGSGPGGRSVNQSSGIGDQLKNSPNQKFLIPKILGKMLGFAEKESQTVSDILTYYVGQQTHNNKSDDKKPYLKMLPDEGQQEGNVHYTSIPFNDYMLIQPIDLKGKSTWSLMQQWLNEPLNEMFTCLKCDKEGRILPSVVVRRIPLLSDDFSINARAKGINTSPFSSYPAWALSPDLVIDEDLGRSDATRFNYFHVVGSDPIYKDPNKTERLNNIVTPPAAIEADIARNGLRMYVTRVPAQSYSRVVSAQNNQGRIYTAMMADVLGDQHLKFNGSVASNFIQLPIAEGENLIYNNMLYHIERVSHSGGIGPTGQKMATTQFDLTNGVPLAVLASRTQTENEKAGIEDLDGRKTIKVEESGKLGEMRNNRADLENIGVLGAINTQIK